MEFQRLSRSTIGVLRYNLDDFVVSVVSDDIQTKDVLGLSGDDLHRHCRREAAHHGLRHVGRDYTEAQPTQDYLTKRKR